MPTVPTLAAPRAELAPVKPTYSQLDTRGTNGEAIARGVQAVGQGLSQLGETGLKIWQAETERADNVWLTGAQATLTKASNTSLYGQKGENGQPDVPGLTNLKGESAFGKEQPALEDLEKARQQLIQAAPSHRAREQFDAQSRVMLEGTRVSMNRYVSSQREVVANANTQALVATSLDAIANGYPDPVARAMALALPEDAIRKLAVSPADAEAKVAAFRAQAHQTVLNQYLLSGDVEGAQKYYAQVDKELGDQGGQVRARITSEANALKGATTAASIFTESKIAGTQWVDPVAAYAKLDALPEGKVKEEALQHLSAQVQRSEKLRGRAIDEQVAVLQALQLEQGTTLTIQGRDAKRWLMDARNGPEAREALYKFEHGLESDRRQNLYWANAERREQDERDEAARARFLAQPFEDQAKASIGAEYADASTKARDQIRALQLKASEVVRKDNAVDSSEFQQRVKAQAEGTFKGNKKTAAAFEGAMRRWYLEEWLPENNNKPPTSVEVIDKMRALLLYGDAQGGSLFSKDQFKFQVKPGDPFVPFKDEDQPAPINQRTGPQRQGGGPVVPASAKTPDGNKPPASRPPLTQRASQLRSRGLTPAQIAAQLTQEGY